MIKLFKKPWKNFILFEGLDGTGKSSLCKLLYSQLKKAKAEKTAFFTNEPTLEPLLVQEIDKVFLGPMIKTFLKKHNHLFFSNPDNVEENNHKKQKLSMLSQLISIQREDLWFDRSHGYINCGNTENRTFKKLLIGDRGIISSYVYQSLGMKEEDLKPIYELNKRFPIPSVIIYCYCDPKVAHERIYARMKDDMNTIELDKFTEWFYEKDKKYRKLLFRYLQENEYKNIRSNTTTIVIDTSEKTLIESFEELKAKLNNRAF